MCDTALCVAWVVGSWRGPPTQASEPEPMWQLAWLRLLRKFFGKLRWGRESPKVDKRCGMDNVPGAFVRGDTWALPVPVL